MAQASYLVAHRGEAFIVNPVLYDLERTYLRDLRRYDLQLRGIFVTHCPYEYVSGHAELSAITGATVYFGAEEKRLHGTCHDPSLECRATEDTRVPLDAKHRERERARLYWRLLPTPGHTLGAVAWLLCRRQSKKRKLGEQVLLTFTGASFLTSGLGRFDLENLVCKTAVGAEEMAEAMYSSVQALMGTVQERTEVFPSVLGPLQNTFHRLRRLNPFFQDMPKGVFLERARRVVRSHGNYVPAYFYGVVRLNRSPKIHPLQVPVQSAAEFKRSLDAAQNKCALVVDVRSAEDWCNCHIKGSVCFPLHTTSSMEAFWGIWFGNIAAPNALLFLVAPEGQQQELLNRLQLIGYASVGSLTVVGDLDELQCFETASVPLCTTSHLRGMTSCLRERGGTPSSSQGATDVLLLDVRCRAEFDSSQFGHLMGAKNVPLLEVVTSPLRCVGSTDRECALFCNNGFRSVVAASYLAGAGVAVKWVPGGYESVRVAPELCTTW